MKNLTIFSILTLALVTIISAQPILNIYLDNEGNADIIGNSDSAISLPSGVEYENGKIFGSTQLLTSKNAELWAFNFSTDQKVEISLYLPEYASLETTPENSIIFVNKNQILITTYSNELSLTYKLHEKPSSFPYYWILLFVIIVVFVFLFIKFRKKPKITPVQIQEKKPIDKLKIMKDVLNEREKLILNKLKYYKDNNIKIKQNQLRKALDIPKASFSRHLQELEKKNLIKRIGEGKNKFIELK